MASVRYVITCISGFPGHDWRGPFRAQTPAKLPVVATFSILADFARNVGGERIEVTALVGPNGDTHVYQPKPADAKELGAARLILVNGLGLEGWIDRLIKASGAKAPVVVATKGIKSQQMREEGRVGLDPHAWQSIANAKIYVANIRDGLIAADPEGASAYRANADNYLGKLDTLEKEVTAEIAKIPPGAAANHHDPRCLRLFRRGLWFPLYRAGRYLDRDRGERPRCRQNHPPDQGKKIPAVFLENVTDPRLVQSIAAESGAKIGGTLYSDALSPPDGPASTYIDMMRNNVRELSAALAK